MVQALRLNTMSKLTFADSSRFDALVKDVFSGVNFTDVEDQILMNALEQVYKEARLELIPSQVCVCVCVCMKTSEMLSAYVYVMVHELVFSQCREPLERC